MEKHPYFVLNQKEIELVLGWLWVNGCRRQFLLWQFEMRSQISRRWREKKSYRIEDVNRRLPSSSLPMAQKQTTHWQKSHHITRWWRFLRDVIKSYRKWWEENSHSNFETCHWIIKIHNYVMIFIKSIFHLFCFAFISENIWILMARRAHCACH